MSSTETLDAGQSRRSLVSSPSEQKKKSILKKSDSGSSRSGGGSVIVVGTGAARNVVGDPERENLLMSDPESSAAETPDVSRKRLPLPNYSSNEAPATATADATAVSLPPTQLNCDLVKSLVGPKIRTSGNIINRGMSMADHNNHNNNGTNNTLTIKFVKLPDDEKQRMAASNNVNNNVSSLQQQQQRQLQQSDFVTRATPMTQSSSRSNGMTSKEIQTSTANLTSGGSAGNSGGRKFERGRDPHRQRSPQLEATSEEMMTSQGAQNPRPQCSNLNCRHNIPASTSSTTSHQRVVCLCGNVMTVTSSNEPQQPNLIHLRQGEKPFIFVEAGASDETSSSTIPDQISS